MADKKKGYSLLLGLTILLTLAGALTMFPMASASKTCLIGYSAVCSWAPISALLLFLAAGIVCIIRKKTMT